jgi:hypothetical protein
MTEQSYVDQSTVERELTGQVRTEKSALSGAVVQLVDTTGHEIGRAVTETDGTFRLPIPDAGQCLLLAAAEGYQPVIDLVDADRPTPRDIVLERFSSGISGVVRDQQSGRPVVGSCVRLVDGRGITVRRAVTGADGRYEFPAIAAGEYSIVVGGLDPAASSASLPGGERTELDLHLD